MADGFVERGSLSYQTVTKSYSGDNSANQPSISERTWLDEEPTLRLSDRALPYKINEYNSDTQNQTIKLNAEVFGRVFGNQSQSEDDDRRSKDARIVLHYPAKFLGIHRIGKRKFLVRAVAGRSSANNPDGTKEQGFVSTVRLSRKLQEAMPKNVLLDGILNFTIEQRDISFTAGMFGAHPRNDVNLGWLFVHVSILVSVVFFMVGLLADAYHWDNILRHFLEAGDHWVRSRVD